MPKHLNHGSRHSLTVKTIDTLKPCFCREWTEGNYRLRRFGMTCKRCGGICFSQLILSLQDFRVRMFLLRELGSVWMESEADYFSRSLDWLANYDQNSSSWKMCQESFPFLTRSQERWPAFGMIVDGKCYRLKPLELRTSESAGSYWPTPTASEGGYNRSASPNAAIRPTLSTMARNNLWPTPLDANGAKDTVNSMNYGTPKLPKVAAEWVRFIRTARDRKGQNTPSTHGHYSPSLDLKISSAGHKEYLNPRFVEVMMGWNIGATRFESWATALFQRKPGKPLCV